MLGRLIQVGLALLLVSMLFRLVRSAFGRSARREPAPPSADLDPAKRVAASWSEVGSDPKGGKAD